MAKWAQRHSSKEHKRRVLQSNLRHFINFNMLYNLFNLCPPKNGQPYDSDTKSVSLIFQRQNSKKTLNKNTIQAIIIDLQKRPLSSQKYLKLNK